MSSVWRSVRHTFAKWNGSCLVEHSSAPDFLTSLCSTRPVLAVLATMVIAVERQDQLERSIANARLQIADAESQWTPFSPDGRRQPLEHWQQQAASLNASRMGMFGQEEELRRSQRAVWKRDEFATRKEALDLRIQTLREIIEFREQERQEAASTFVPIEREMARKDANEELSARRTRRVARTQSEARWPASPATAPTPSQRKAAREPPPTPPRGRAPPGASPVWSNNGLGVRGGQMRTGRGIAMQQMPMWQPAWRASPVWHDIEDVLERTACPPQLPRRTSKRTPPVAWR